MFQKSGHVSHLRSHRREYAEAIWSFLDKAYFMHLREGIAK